MPRQQLTLQQRFDRNVIQQLGCWEWAASTNAYGYAILMVQPGEIPGQNHTYPKATGAHRVSWFLAHGSFPLAQLQLDHICHNESDCPGGITCPHRRCTNPDHLEAVSLAENSRRGSARQHRSDGTFTPRTHCQQGHEYNPDNVIRYTDHVLCQICLELQRTNRPDKRRTQVTDLTSTAPQNPPIVVPT